MPFISSLSCALQSKFSLSGSIPSSIPLLRVGHFHSLTSSLVNSIKRFLSIELALPSAWAGNIDRVVAECHFRNRYVKCSAELVAL